MFVPAVNGGYVALSAIVCNDNFDAGRRQLR